MRRLAAAALLCLAACQPVPRPFTPASGGPLPLASPADSAGVVVLPVEGAPGAADALAKALRDADVLATTGAGNRESARLEGSVTPQANGLAFAWTLRDAAGKSLGRGSASGTSVDALAKSAAGPIVRVAAGEAPIAADVPAQIAVKGVSGAPGDGGTSLARAIGDALGRAGVAVGDGKARYDLLCRVAVAPPRDGQQTVSVRWVLARPEGHELGQVEQHNAVPAGSLDGPWGDIAYAVAAAAAPGIAQLIRHADTQ